MKLLIHILTALTIGSAAGEEEREVCTGNCVVDGLGNKECTFTSKLNFAASEWGYYYFDECGEETNPVLGIQPGVSYVFDQSDYSNWYHPLGFAYYADGAHDGVDELEPDIAPPESLTGCAEDASCPAPMYLVDGEYVGTYSNNYMVAEPTANETNFGLDDYEPLFFLPIKEWTKLGAFTVKLMISEDALPMQDIFYFCHIHQYMTGRIKILDADGAIVNEEDSPEIPYPYADPDSFDVNCGTHNITDYQLPNPMCPDKFVCDVGNKYNFKMFAGCIDAMDCHMLIGMTTGISAESELALFIHQMIPHHQNAVNMAKALHKTGKVNCLDMMSDTDDCIMQRIIIDIMAGQNHQIQVMRGILAAKSYPENDQCMLSKDEDGNTEMVTSAVNLYGPQLTLLLLGLSGFFLAVL